MIARKLEAFRLLDEDVDWGAHDEALRTREFFAAPTGEEVPSGDQLGLAAITWPRLEDAVDMVVIDGAGFNETPLNKGAIPSWTARRNAMLVAAHPRTMIVAPAMPGTFTGIPEGHVYGGHEIHESQLAMSEAQHEALERGRFSRVAEGMTRVALDAIRMTGVALEDVKVLVIGASQGASMAAGMSRALLKEGQRPDGVYLIEPVALAELGKGRPELARRFFAPSEQDAKPYVALNPPKAMDAKLDEGPRAWVDRLRKTRRVHGAIATALTMGGMWHDFGRLSDFEGTNWLLASGERSGLSRLDLNARLEGKLAARLGQGAVERVMVKDAAHPISLLFDLYAQGVKELAN